LKQVLLATRNRKKLGELKRLLKGFGIRTLSLDNFKGMPDVKEDKDTFRGNAIKKSIEISKKTDILVISDDSGLEVQSLNNAPGVKSARYAGAWQDDDKNIAKLLKAMKGLAGRQRKACFRCFICISKSGKVMRVVSGRVDGQIAEERSGASGFGYDPVFIPKGFDKTFAQMRSKEKDQISHRAAALNKARTVILEYFQKYPL
jgi:XTP/dITP diphosphohydrolase